MLRSITKIKAVKGLAGLIAPLVLASGIHFSNAKTANAGIIGDFVEKQMEEIIDHTVNQMTDGEHKTYEDAIKGLKIPEQEEQTKKTKPRKKDKRVFGAIHLKDGTRLKNVRYNHAEFVFLRKGRELHIPKQDILLIDFSKEKNKDIVYLRDGSILKNVQYKNQKLDISSYMGNMKIDQDQIKLFIFGRKRKEKKLEDKAIMKKLTNSPLNDNYSFWSPDGKKIAYISAKSGGQGHIYVMNADGSNKKKLTSTYMGIFSWSPDSKKIASISKEKGKQYNMYVVDADGRNEKRLATLTGDFYDWFAWSPDSKKIAFTSRYDAKDYDVYVVNADGSNEKRLTKHPKLDVFHSWSPDSKQITFTSNRDGNDEVYIMNVDRKK